MKTGFDYLECSVDHKSALTLGGERKRSLGKREFCGFIGRQYVGLRDCAILYMRLVILDHFPYAYRTRDVPETMRCIELGSILCIEFPIRPLPYWADSRIVSITRYVWHAKLV